MILVGPFQLRVFYNSMETSSVLSQAALCYCGHDVLVFYIEKKPTGAQNSNSRIVWIA